MVYHKDTDGEGAIVVGGESLRECIFTADELKRSLNRMAGCVAYAQTQRSLVCLTGGKGEGGKDKEDE